MISDLEFDGVNSKGNEYEVKSIWDNVVYAKESETYL